MPPSTHRLLAVSLVAVLAVVTTACDVTRVVTGPRTWTQSTESTTGRVETVTVTDTTGRIANVDFDPPGVETFGGAANPAGEPNVVLVPWTGGACDDTTNIAIEPEGGGLQVTVRISALPGDCDAIGIGHVLRLSGTAALPAASVSVSQLPTP